MVVADGLLIAGAVASLSNRRLTFGGKYLVVGTISTLLALQWAAVIPLGNDLVLDVGNRVLVRTLRLVGSTAQDPMIEVGIRWLLPSITFVSAHRLALATFFCLVGSYVILIGIFETLPWAFEPLISPLSRGALASLQLPGRRMLPVLTVALWIGSEWWTELSLAVDALLGVYAAWGARGVLLTAMATPDGRVPATVLVGACCLYLPVSPVLGVVGLIEHFAGLTRLLPPGRAGSVAAPFCQSRHLGRYTRAIVVYLFVFAAMHPVLDAEHAPPAGPWLGPAPTPVSPDEFVATPTGSVFLGRAEGPFWIDEYEYPNDSSRPALAGVSFRQAEATCIAEGKRLCTQEEWLFACEDLTTLNGDPVRDPRKTCTTGAPFPPSGPRPGCRSASGIHALLGGVWEWTASSDSSHGVLKGSSDSTLDDIRFSCRYRYRVQELQEDKVQLEQVGFRCCLDAVPQTTDGD